MRSNGMHQFQIFAFGPDFGNVSNELLARIAGCNAKDSLLCGVKKVENQI
jgi:hypothetical protein